MVSSGTCELEVVDGGGEAIPDDPDGQDDRDACDDQNKPGCVSRMPSMTKTDQLSQNIPSQLKALNVHQGGVKPLVRATAATHYMGFPIVPPLAVADGASWCGWRVSFEKDSATSRKYPARFCVLTRTAPRTRQLGDFTRYPSIANMRHSLNKVVVIGFDTEFVTVDDYDPERGWVGESSEVVRRILSYQFTCVDPEDRTLLRQCVILPMEYEGPGGVMRVARLSIQAALRIIITKMALHKHECAVGWSHDGVPRSEVVDAQGRSHERWWFSRERALECPHELSEKLSICLVAHYAHADATSFLDPRRLREAWCSTYPGRAKPSTSPGFEGMRTRILDRNVPDILRGVLSASGGMVTSKPVDLVVPGKDRRWAMPVRLSVRDTMAHSGAQPLSELGQSVGVPKLDVDSRWKAHMDEYLKADPQEFLEYAVNDAVIALEYCAMLYGDDRLPPLTLPTASATAMKAHIRASHLWRAADFNRIVGGLMEMTTTKELTVSLENQLSYYQEKGMQPIDGAAATWLHATARAFSGGYNACSEIGVFPETTFDLDLQSCYPTSTSCVLDVDYCHPQGVITRSVNHYELTLDDFGVEGPLCPFVGFVTFEFPDTVAYPSIPVPVEGSPTYPLSTGGSRGVWAMSPEVWLALRLGARVYCQIGHFGRVRRIGDGADASPSRVFRSAYRSLIADRARAKQEFGRKSFLQSVLKLAANSVYGKLAQGVLGERGWNAWAQSYEPVAGSAITNPYTASMTTSLARAVLLAALNQLHDLGYSTPSATTDGLITTASVDVVEGLDLYGLADVWRDSREALTGDRTMWEEKHRQDDLLNITTRGNFSREPGGVLAHAGYKVPETIVKDSQADRDFMYNLMVTREGALPMTMKVFPSVHELTRIENRRDFAPLIRSKQMVIEFDRKRRPVLDGMTFHTLTVDGKEYEIAHVQTVPWRTPEECVVGRDVDKGLKKFDRDSGEYEWTRCPVRRTRQQWEDYCERLDAALAGRKHLSEAERLDQIAKGIVIAHRQGVIHITWLDDSTRTVDERLNAFEKFDLPRPSYRFWTHAKSKTERQIEIDLEAIAPYVEQMQEDNPFPNPPSDSSSENPNPLMENTNE